MKANISFLKKQLDTSYEFTKQIDYIAQGEELILVTNVCLLICKIVGEGGGVEGRTEGLLGVDRGKGLALEVEINRIE